MTTLYGIKNCDTVKKSRRWLSQHGVDYVFHDFRSQGLDDATLNAWVNAVGWERLLNRRGTTWRKLTDAQRETINEQSARELMLSQHTLIKRPVIEHNGQVLVGHDETVLRNAFLT